MKKSSILILLSLPVFVFGENFTQLQKDISNSLTYKISQNKVKLYQEKLKSIHSKNYGSLNLSYQGVYFLTRPYMKTTTAVGALPNGRLVYENINVNTADKTHYIGEIKYSYPIFNKLLSSSINKSKLEIIKQKLNLQNIKRILTLKVAELYSNIYALTQNIKALNVAKKALLTSKQKAKAFYESGLLDKSNLDEINAKYYEILSNIEDLKSQKNSLLQTLSYLLNKKIQKIDGIDIKENKIIPNFQNRADVKMIKESLKISNQDIKVAKADNYPTIGLEVGLKREADNVGLSRNAYSNLDQSYVGIGINYEFDGSKKYNIETAKIAKNINTIFYQDYLNKIKTQYNSDLNKQKALFYQLKSAKEEIKARESYYNYIQAKFNEGLSDSSDLNDAIAKLANSQAKKEYIKSQIFLIEQKLKLNGGVK